jgi:enoyl-CoA hydratase/carnithine racemase
VEEEAGLVTLTINRPEKRNALSTAMMTELNAELSAIGKQADAAYLPVCAPQIFCASHAARAQRLYSW